MLKEGIRFNLEPRKHHGERGTGETPLSSGIVVLRVQKGPTNSISLEDLETGARLHPIGLKYRNQQRK